MKPPLTKKIFFITPSFRGGGAERATVVVANELAKVDDLDVTLISLSSDGPLRKLATYVDVIDLEKTKAREAVWDVRKLLKDEQPDVVFSVLQQANILMYLLDKISHKTWKTVHMLQNYYEKIIAKENKVMSYLFRKSLEAADAVIPNAYAMGKNLIAATNVDSQNVKPIYNPIDTDAVKTKSEESVTEDVFKKSPVLVGCGRLEEQKGFTYLIEALPEIKERHPEAQIVLLGEGSLRDELESQARDLGVNDSVHFFGFVDNPYKYMQAADVFVLPSLWEGLPTVLIEAMAAGGAVVSTDCPSGPQEILEGGEHGLLVPVADSGALSDAIITLLANKVLADSYVKKARERADDFTIEESIREYKKFLQKI